MAAKTALKYSLELVNVPISDIERAKQFYVEQAGFNLDHDHTVSDEIHFLQLTPNGSPASISIGKGLTTAEPGSDQGLQLVVDDVGAARSDLLGRGVEVSDVEEFAWGRFAYFSDPDGNSWVLQEANPQS